MKRDMPPVLWVAIAACGLAAVGKVVASFKIGPSVLIDAALTTVLAVGLLLGKKWAFVLTIVAVLVGMFFGFRKSIMYGYAVLGMNVVVLLPVALSKSYFFPKPDGDRLLSCQDH